MEVRPARPDDLDELIASFAAVVAEGRWLGTQPGFDREARRQGLAASLDDATVGVFVAEEGGRLLGGIRGQDGGGLVELGMWVVADARGRGVGAALLDALVAWARQRGAHKVSLQVWPHNQRARTLYRRAGFVDEGRLRRHYRRASGDLWDAVVMGLVLDTTSPGAPYDDRPPADGV